MTASDDAGATSGPVGMTPVSAGVVLIGDELLSGRTQDVNLRAIAQYLQPQGVDVAEARVVSDRQEAIVEAVNALRARCAYVFTTGGIGPTHDDITAEAVSAAFGVPCEVNPDALAILETRYAARDESLTPARRRMARMPQGAVLIDNPATGAPGFQIENVFVLAGVPGIMKSMLAVLDDRIHGGAVLESLTVRAPGLREGDIGDRLSALQGAHDAVAIGSYPYFRGLDDYGVHLVARGRDVAALEAACLALSDLVRAAGVEPQKLETER